MREYARACLLGVQSRWMDEPLWPRSTAQETFGLVLEPRQAAQNVRNRWYHDCGLSIPYVALRAAFFVALRKFESTRPITFQTFQALQGKAF